jgi:glycine/D-amino acid oxidase-like deaminating enzyme
MKHVELVTGDVLSHLVEDGVVTKDGTVYKVDAVVFATGFNTTVGLNDVFDRDVGE